MDKEKKKQRAGQDSGQPSKSDSSTPSIATLKTNTAIASDPTLGYKFRVILHDFLNVVKDPNSEQRINATTDEHYISLPYFNQDEATVIKSAIVDDNLSQHDLGALFARYAHEVDEEEGEERRGERENDPGSVIEVLGDKTLDGVVRALLMSFLEKRRASGDSRPCKPHHLAPMFAALLGLIYRRFERKGF
jgi:hypothetical protein